MLTLAYQILRSDDQELIYTGAWILTRAHLSQMPGSADQAIRHAEIAIKAACRMQSRKRLEEMAMLRALIAHGANDVESKRQWTNCWADLRDGNDTEETLRNHGLDEGRVELSAGATSLAIAQAVDEIIVKMGVRIARSG